jgi:integrase
MPPRTPPSRRGRPARPRGSVYWHAASERWCAQAPPDRRGRRRSRYFADEDSAWDWLAAQLEALDDGIDLAAGAERLSAYLKRWLAREKANPDRDWAASTRRTYGWAVARISAHRLARTPVADLTRDHVDTLLADLADELGRRSLTVVRSLLRSTLADLADDGVIARNPVRRQRIARHLAAPESEHCPWSEEDARRFLAAARAHSQRPALWWLVTSCGLRSGEVRSLKLTDLDLAAGTLTFYRPKTRKMQVLDLPTNVIAALRDHLRQKRAIGGPLFQARPNEPMCGATLREELQKLRAKAGVPPIERVHDLRHVAASLMLANGYPVTTTAAILGHTPKTLLTTYAHAVPKHVVQAPRTIAAVLPWIDGPAQHTTRSKQATDSRSAVRSAVRGTASPPSQEAVAALLERKQSVLEAPADSEEQAEQPRAQSAGSAE